MVGVATTKLRKRKHVQTRGTSNKLSSDERNARDGTQCCSIEWRYRQADQYEQFCR